MLPVNFEIAIKQFRCAHYDINRFAVVSAYAKAKYFSIRELVDVAIKSVDRW